MFFADTNWVVNREVVMLLLSTVFFHLNGMTPIPNDPLLHVNTGHQSFQRYRMVPVTRERVSAPQAMQVPGATPTVASQGLGTPTGSSNWTNSSRGLVPTNSPRRPHAPGAPRR